MARQVRLIDLDHVCVQVPDLRGEHVGDGVGELLGARIPIAALVGDRLDFQPKRLELPVGRDLLIRFENREKGVAHNLRFKTAPGAPKTKLAKGVVVQELNVRFDQPGEYRYTCDLHPLMTGVAVVA